MQRLMIWYPAGSPIELAYRCQVAANRIQATFRGDASDDQLFWPWLYLQRHIAELTMKHAILWAAALRRDAGDTNPALDSDEVKERFRRELGHQLVPLANELNSHLEALNLGWIDDETFGLLRDLADMDPGGTSFRGTDGLGWQPKHNGFHVDFPSLAEALEDMNNWLGMTIEQLDAVGEHQAEIASYPWD